MASLQTYALTTLADVKESLSIPSATHTYDNLIIRKINQATAMIENYCGRRFKQTDYTDEVYNATGSDQLVLKQRPVVGGITLKVRETALNQESYNTAATSDYFVDNASGVVDTLFNAGGRWGVFAVTYTAGYSTIPDDLAEATASLAAYLVNTADSSTINAKSKQEGQRKLEYSATPIAGALDIFQRLGINDLINSYANDAVFADK